MEGGRAMSINDLFCTPDQGRRLKELVPSLRPSMVWASFGDDNLIPWVAVNHESTLRAPALTLQELRDYARNADFVKGGDSSSDGKWFALGVLARTATAPELAAWVIERLEATP
jgi:hypothetical protein